MQSENLYENLPEEPIVERPKREPESEAAPPKADSSKPEREAPRDESKDKKIVKKKRASRSRSRGKAKSVASKSNPGWFTKLAMTVWQVPKDRLPSNFERHQFRSSLFPYDINKIVFDREGPKPGPLQLHSQETDIYVTSLLSWHENQWKPRHAPVNSAQIYEDWEEVWIANIPYAPDKGRKSDEVPPPAPFILYRRNGDIDVYGYHVSKGEKDMPGEPFHKRWWRKQDQTPSSPKSGPSASEPFSSRLLNDDATGGSIHAPNANRATIKATGAKLHTPPAVQELLEQPDGVATVAKTLPPKRPKHGSGEACLRNFVVRADPRTAEYLKELNIFKVEVSENSGAMHPKSAAVRQFCIATAFSHLVDRGVKQILLYGGTQREAAIFDRLLVDYTGNKPSLTVYSIKTTSKDVGRSDKGITRFNPLSQRISDFDGILMVDIYGSVGGPTVIDREFMAELASHAIVAWVGHPLIGACGTIENEGAWLKVYVENRGVQVPAIQYAPDAKTPYLPLHATCKWMQRDGTHSSPTHGDIAWTVWRTISDTNIVIFGKVEGPIEEIRGRPQRSRYERVELPFPQRLWWMPETVESFLSDNCPRILSLFGKRRATVDRQWVSAIQGWMTGRSMASYSYRQGAQHAKALFEKDPSFLALAAIFPKEAAMLPLDTFQYAIAIQSSMVADDAHGLVIRHGVSFAKQRAAVVSLDRSPTPASRKWLYVAAAVLMLSSLYLYRRRTNPTMASLPEFLMTYLRYVQWKFYEYRSGFQELLASESKIRMAKSAVTRTQEQIQTIRPAKLGVLVLTEVATALLEESVKRFHPLAGAALVGFEGLIRFIYLKNHVGMTTSTAGTMTAAMTAFHVGTALLPLPLGVAVHTVYNCAVRLNLPPGHPGSATSFPFEMRASTYALLNAMFESWVHPTPSIWDNPFDEFVNCVYEGPWLTRSPWTSSGSSRPIDFVPERGIIPKEGNSHYSVKPLDNTLDVRQRGFHYTLDNQGSFHGYVYWILPTSVPGYCPAPTDNNLLDAITSRILVQPPMDPQRQADAWSSCKQVVSCRFADCVLTWEDCIGKYLDHLEPAKRREVERALERVRTCSWPDLQDICYRENQVFVKTNELLLQGIQMKPRIIVNVSKRAAAPVACLVYAATERVKEVWSWDLTIPTPVISTDEELGAPWIFHITYGSSATDVLLTEWMAQVLELAAWHVAILVAGDDSLVAVMLPFQGLVFFEADASMYDQSISTGPLQYEFETLCLLGLPPEGALILQKIASAPYVAHSKKQGGYIKVHHPQRPMRPTGGPDTSVGNGICMAGAWANVIMGSQPNDLLVEELCRKFKALGFSMKMKSFYSPFDCSFLKGTWYPVKGKVVWGPLPSRILKMGKSLVDPRTIYRMKGDYAGACRLFMNDIANSYSKCVQAPLIADFVDNYRIGQPSSVVVSTPEPWKVQFAYGASPGRPDNVDNILRRYGWDMETYSAIKRLIQRADLFQFLDHPGFEDLARVDYR